MTKNYCAYASIGHWLFLIYICTPGNHTVAVIKGKESYELLQTSCARIFADVNRIVKDGKIEVDGKEIAIDMHLGGDNKVTFFGGRG